jgi:hypothetical protein
MAKCSKLGEIIPKTMEQRFKSLSLFEFQERFSNAADCLKYLADEKWGNGFVCRKCGHTHSCAGKATQSRQCTCCRYVESPTAQTLFHKVKFDLLKAFYIVYFVSTNKKGITSTELSRKLNLRQKTCWGFKRKNILIKTSQLMLGKTQGSTVIMISLENFMEQVQLLAQLLEGPDL